MHWLSWAWDWIYWIVGGIGILAWGTAGTLFFTIYKWRVGQKEKKREEAREIYREVRLLSSNAARTVLDLQQSLNGIAKIGPEINGHRSFKIDRLEELAVGIDGIQEEMSIISKRTGEIRKSVLRFQLLREEQLPEFDFAAWQLGIIERALRVGKAADSIAGKMLEKIGGHA